MNYESFLAYIEQMVRHKESGALFMRTDLNHSVVLGVDQGEIVAIAAGPKRGLEAIDRITEMSSCSLRRDERMVLGLLAGGLPSTNEILQRLNEGRSEQAAAEPKSSGSEPSPAEGRPIDPSRAGKILCDLLHEFLGPVAPMICDEITDNGRKLQTSNQLADAISRLAGEIDSAAEARAFRDKAYRLLADQLP
jgi:hypothetical protein